MSENYNSASMPAGLIDAMVDSVADVFYESSRDAFVEWAKDYLKSNGTLALSDALANNTDKYISMLELGKLITDAGSFVDSCFWYESAEENQKTLEGAKILSNFFGVTSDVVDMLPFDPIVGTYISMVFEIADYALNEGAAILEAHNNQLLDVIELCDMATNDHSSFDGYINRLANFAAMNRTAYIHRNSVKKLYENAEALSETNENIKIEGSKTELLNLVDEYNNSLDDLREYLANFLDEAVARGIQISADTLKEIENICGNLSVSYDYSYDVEKGILVSAHSSNKTFGNAEKIGNDPIVIDIGKSGFELTSQENGAHFDMDSNTLAEKTAWIKGDDAFLALDRNGDGVINNGGELFGDRTMLKNGTYAKSGFEALAEYDDDLNGIINAHDEIFNQLLLWQDKNGDGISTSDELISLNDAAITAINLGHESVNSTDEESGSILANISSAVFEDGTESAVGEFKFNSDKIDTTESITFDISDEIKALPNVRAIGRVHSLHYEMAMDTSGTLIQLVKRFTESEDITERKNILDDILYFICNATDIAPTSRGSYIDARQLAVIENMIDHDYDNPQIGTNPNNAATNMLKPLYQELRSAYYGELVYDDIKEYLNFIDIRHNEDGTVTYDLSLFNSYLNFQLNYGKISETTLINIGIYLFNNKPAFENFINYFKNSNASYANLILGYCDGVVGTEGNDNLYASGNNYIFGRGGNDIIRGSNENDVIDGGVGNDNLCGNYGDDTYIFNRGYGTDLINDRYGLNTVSFGEDINPEDIVLIKNGNNLEMQIKGTDDKVIIQYYFYNNNNYSNFKYNFADGTTWVKDDITSMIKIVNGSEDDDRLDTICNNSELYGYGGNDIIYGSDGNDIIDGGEGYDSIRGYDGNDTIDGGEGNDNLYGGSGDDTYIFNKGYGTDVIDDSHGLNTVSFGEGISPEDIVLVKKGNNLELRIKGSVDKVIIQDYFYNDNYSNFKYIFADGTTWSKDDISAMHKSVEYADRFLSFSDYSTFTFAEGFNSENFTVVKNGNDLEFCTRGFKYVIPNYFNDCNNSCYKFYFSDGTTLGENDIADMLKVVNGANGNDRLDAIYNNTELYGYGGNDTIYGSDGDDIIDGGVGNDSLYGGSGDDTYIFNNGYGTDLINDRYGLDTVKFGEGINPEDIVLVKNGNNLEMQVKGTDDKVIIQDYFRNNDYSNFKYSFADGSVATVNKETLAFEFPDINNNYAFSSGDGEVRISDSEGEDVLQINADILSTMFSRNGDDLDIQLNRSDDKVTVENWFADENNQIESITSSDGYALTNNQVQLLIENMSAFTSENNISWADAIQQDSSAVKSVLEQIWVKAG